jgi:hypothetical protein
MAMPTKEKTWNSFDVGNVVNTMAQATDMKAVLLGLKTAMVAAGWTVSLSSNATSSGADDYWDTTTDLNWGTTGARSWIVLRNPDFFGAGAHFELLLECRWASSSYPMNLGVKYSPTGDYAGGNTTTLPTATTGVELVTIPTGTADDGNFLQGSTMRRAWHFACSSDRQCTRFFVTQRLGEVIHVTTFFAIEHMKAPVAGLADADQFVVLWFSDESVTGTSTKTLVTQWNAAARAKSYVAGSGAVTYYLTGEFCNGALVRDQIRAANPDDGDSWPLFPIGLVTITNVGYAYGRNGELFDMWWAPAMNTELATSPKNTGTTFPNDGSCTFIQLGDLVFPWDGSEPVLT